MVARRLSPDLVITRTCFCLMAGRDWNALSELHTRPHFLLSTSQPPVLKVRKGPAPPDLRTDWLLLLTKYS